MDRIVPIPLATYASSLVSRYRDRLAGRFAHKAEAIEEGEEIAEALSLGPSQPSLRDDVLCCAAEGLDNECQSLAHYLLENHPACCEQCEEPSPLIRSQTDEL